MSLSQPYKTRQRNGQTLLELVAATTILAIAIVPGLKIMRDGIAVSRQLETASVLTTLCASKLEQQMAVSAADWSMTTASGTFSAEGYSQLRYRVTCSDSSGNGGIDDRLMTITATTWEDTDSDGLFDDDEANVVLSTKIASHYVYQYKASI